MSFRTELDFITDAPQPNNHGASQAPWDWLADTKSGTDAPKQPKRAALPPELPRAEMPHEPESTVCTTPDCGCQVKRIGEDVMFRPHRPAQRLPPGSLLISIQT